MTASVHAGSQEDRRSHDRNMRAPFQRQMKRPQRPDDRPFQGNAFPPAALDLSPAPEHDSGVFPENLDPVDVLGEQVGDGSKFHKRIILDRTFHGLPSLLFVACSTDDEGLLDLSAPSLSLSRHCHRLQLGPKYVRFRTVYSGDSLGFPDSSDRAGVDGGRA